MADYDLEELNYLFRRLSARLETLPAETDSWERAVLMGEIRFIGLRIFRDAHDQLHKDGERGEPHNWGPKTLYAYLIAAYENWRREVHDPAVAKGETVTE